MNKTKIILVPVDFNNASKKALRFAAYLQKHLSGKIVLLHVSKSKENNAALFENMQSLIVSAKLLPINCSIIIETGNVTDAIIEAHKTHHAGLIVMGTRGADTLGRGITGTNTYVVINKAQCPVIVIPKAAKLKPVKTIVLNKQSQRHFRCGR